MKGRPSKKNNVILPTLTADQLKASVLQMAVQGKLVPQLEEEAPVDIKGEEIEDPPFAIPEKWKWVRLGEISNIVRGGSPRPIKDYITTAADGINWIKIGDSVRGSKYITRCLEKIKPEGISKSRFVYKGTLILSNSMSFGFPYILQIDGCIHDGWLAISNFEKNYLAEYLYVLLLSPFCRSSFKNKAAGAVVKNLNIDKVAITLLPLPPLSEQHCIVDRLNAIMPLIEEYGKAQTALAEIESSFPAKLRASFLQYAIQGKLVPQLESEPAVKIKGEELEEPPFAIPEKWKWVKITDCVEVYPKVTAEDDLEVSFVPMPLIKEGYGNEMDMSTVKRWKEVKKGFTKFQDGDVVLAKITPCFQNKKSAIVTKAKNGVGAGTTEFHVLRCKRNITSSYLLCFLKSPYLIMYGTEHFKGTAGQQRFGTEDLKQCPIPLPPLPEQHRIVERLKEILGCVDSMENFQLDLSR